MKRHGRREGKGNETRNKEKGEKVSKEKRRQGEKDGQNSHQGW